MRRPRGPPRERGFPGPPSTRGPGPGNRDVVHEEASQPQSHDESPKPGPSWVHGWTDRITGGSSEGQGPCQPRHPLWNPFYAQRVRFDHPEGKFLPNPVIPGRPTCPKGATPGSPVGHSGNLFRTGIPRIPGIPRPVAPAPRAGRARTPEPAPGTRAARCPARCRDRRPAGAPPWSPCSRWCGPWR